MSLTKFTGATNWIRSLIDKPTKPASELKEDFDKAGELIKTYLNETLTTEVDTALETKADSSNTYNKTQIDNMIGDSGWKTITIPYTSIAPLVEGSTIYYRKIGNIVQVNASLKTSASGANRIAPNTVIATIPSGYRPSKKYVQMNSIDNYDSYRLTINTDGEITAWSKETGGYMPYSTHFQIEAMYMVD